AILARRVGQPAACLGERRKFLGVHDDGNDGLSGLRCDTGADPAEHAAEQKREQRPQKEEEERLRQYSRGEVAAGDDKGGARAVHSPSSGSPIASAAAAPAIATNASWRPGRSMDRDSMPAPPSISALSKGSGPESGSSKIHSPF